MFYRSHVPSLRLHSVFSTSARAYTKQPVPPGRYQIHVPPPGSVSELTPPKGNQQWLYEISIPSKVDKLPRWTWWAFRISGVATGGLGIFWWTHREQVSITGTWRFNFMSSIILKMEDLSYHGMLKEVEPAILPPNYPAVIMVGRVLDKLLLSAGMEHLEWKVHVVNAPDIVNASVSPSGKVMVYMGILPVCEDESGIATVLSHEIGHVLASHSAEQASSFLFFGIASIPTWPIMGLAALGIVIEELVVVCTIYLLPILGAGAFFSRKRESEADYIGLVIMAKAGYDIRTAVGFWERMKEEGGRRKEIG